VAVGAAGILRLIPAGISPDKEVEKNFSGFALGVGTFQDPSENARIEQF